MPLKKPVILLEGPDGGGKTTLADFLQRKLQAVLVHHGPALDATATELALSYYWSMASSFEGVRTTIIDRAWPSERIYGLRYRGVDRLSSDDVEFLEFTALECTALLVLCLPDKNVARANWQRRQAEAGKEYINSEVVWSTIYDDYANDCDMVSGRTELPTLVYDYNMHTLEELLDEIGVCLAVQKEVVKC